MVINMVSKTMLGTKHLVHKSDNNISFFPFELTNSASGGKGFFFESFRVLAFTTLFKVGIDGALYRLFIRVTKIHSYNPLKTKHFN